MTAKTARLPLLHLRYLDHKLRLTDVARQSQWVAKLVKHRCLKVEPEAPTHVFWHHPRGRHPLCQCRIAELRNVAADDRFKVSQSFRFFKAAAEHHPQTTNYCVHDP